MAPLNGLATRCMNIRVNSRRPPEAIFKCEDWLQKVVFCAERPHFHSSLHHTMSSPTGECQPFTSTTTRQSVDLRHWGLRFTQQRFRSFGEDLSEWSPTKFEDLVAMHGDNCWRTTTGKCKVICRTLGSATGFIWNAWFLTSMLPEMRRDPSEDYNLTGWVVSIFEVMVVIVSLILFVFRIWESRRCFRLKSKDDTYAAYVLVNGIFWLFMVWILLLLFYIKVHTEHHRTSILKTLALFQTRSFSMLFGIMLLGFRRFKNMMILYVEEWKTLFQKRNCTRWMSYFVGLFIKTSEALLTFLAPAALLLKLRQISFVSNQYFKDWTITESFQFAGFVNNMIGLTSFELLTIRSMESVLFMNPDLRKENRENRKCRVEYKDKMMGSSKNSYPKRSYI